jgi:ceramide glucosyltransferase
MFWILILIAFLLACSVVLNSLATWRAWLFVRSSRNFEPSIVKPKVSIFIPVCGIEGTGLSHFRRFCSLDWPCYQVIFTVLDQADPAIPVLKQIESSPSCEVALQVGGSSTGSNLKIRNLLNAWPKLRHDWIVICDADVKVEPQFLSGLFAPFENESRNIGLVHSLYCCDKETTMASSWENVWINCDFWVQGLLGDWLKGTDFAFGAAIGLHRKTLEGIGGLEVVKDFLADDYQIGNRVARTGKRLVFNSEFVTLESKSQSWGETWKHLLRWSRTIRVCQPGGFAGSIVTNISLFAILGLIIHPSSFLIPSISAIAFRIFTANQCRNWILQKRGLWMRFWLIPFKDLAQALLWVLAFSNGTIEWRRNRYSLSSDGKLIPIPS